jgi:hypothetical protein
MANLSITAADVERGTRSGVNYGTAGAAITQGQALYQDSTDGTLKLADADASASAEFVGIALNAAAVGQPITYLTNGNITIGATVATGTAYYVSTTPGAICLESDLSTGDFPTLIGFATSTTVIFVDFLRAGVAKA